MARPSLVHPLGYCMDHTAWGHMHADIWRNWIQFSGRLGYFIWEWRHSTLPQLPFSVQKLFLGTVETPALRNLWLYLTMSSAISWCVCSRPPDPDRSIFQVSSNGNWMVSMLYLGDGKRQTGVVWAKTAYIGTLKARYVQKKLWSWGFKIISSNIINLHCL